MKSVRIRLLLVCTLIVAVPAASCPAADTVRCRNGAVVCVSQPASEVGVQVLRQGGNAVDAAVATAFALAVTYPPAGNIGGGGYLLLVPDSGAAGRVYDFREVAPAAATRDMFVRPADRTPHRRVGVPGTVRGLAMAHNQLGQLPWRDLVLPAVILARDGFALDQALAADLNRVLADSDKNEFAELHRVFGHPDGQQWRAGERLVQPDLAKVLQHIADLGPSGFYQGAVAQLIAEEMRLGGGLIGMADLAAYQPIQREPVRGTYRGHEIVSVPPSSSGGTTLVEMLNMLETFDLRGKGRGTPETLHRMIECMKRGFRDRAAYLGDPAVNSIPGQLLDKEYAAELAATINPDQVTPSTALAGGIPITAESEHTTHLSVVDGQRTAVSLTYTLESPWGSRVVVRGGGFILNDEMNDFNWVPGLTNTEGRIGTPANDVAPGKRMLSSMCPTVVRRGGHNLLVTGSPGGRTIINTVLCMIVNVVDFELDVRSAVDAPRLHHQWLPDVVRYEASLPELSPGNIERLKEMGHRFAEPPRRQGDAHSIWIDPVTAEITAAADRRISGDAAGF